MCIMLYEGKPSSYEGLVLMDAIESLIQTLLALVGTTVAVYEFVAKRARDAELEILRLQLESTGRDVKGRRRRKRRRAQH